MHGPTSESSTEGAAQDDLRRGEALRAAIEQSSPAHAPRIWVGTTADYEAGAPHGRWVSAARTYRAVEGDIRTMLSRSKRVWRSDAPAKWQIFAAEGFGRHYPKTGQTLQEVVARANQMYDEARAYAAWAQLDPENAVHCLQFGHAYQGRFDRLEDWVTLEVERAGYDRLLDERVPAPLRLYVDIDIGGLAHDMRASGEVVDLPDLERGGMWVFATDRIPAIHQ